MVVGACVGQVLTVLGHTVGVTQPALPPERCDVRVSPDVVCCTQLPLGRTVHQVQRATLYKWKFLNCKKKWDKKKSAWKTDVDLYLLSKTYRYFDKKGYNFVPIYNNHPKLLIEFWLKNAYCTQDIMVFVDIHVLIILTQKVKSFVDFDQSLKAVCAASAISLCKHNLHI